ncbi:MAG: hypothetical protein K2J08_12460 [Ruminococcus sp.]|nr:hypothetical protein [Ruminococcus sp.]
MKFTYYSKKKAIDDKCFFTIRIDNDDELFRLNAIIVSGKYEMYTLTDCNFELGVFDDSITNIQSARNLYNQIKQEAMNLTEDELVQRYYFTDDDGEEVFECFATEEDAYNKAKELANEYNSIIYVNTVIGEDIVDSAYPDDKPEAEETIPEVPAPVEESEDVPETTDSTEEIPESLDEHFDPWRLSLAYLITLDDVCCRHVHDIYDFSECVIKSECLSSEWQTSTSKKTIMLAFNLFSGGLSWCPEDLQYYCTPDYIFNSPYNYYYFEALKFLYHFRK